MALGLTDAPATFPHLMEKMPMRAKSESVSNISG